MSYDTWKTTDTVGDEEAGRERARQRDDERDREQRYQDFESFAWQLKVPILLRHVALLMEGQQDSFYLQTEVQQRILAFQEREGWSGVISAIARTLHQVNRGKE